MQEVDETCFSNSKLFTLFLLIACKILNVFLLSLFFWRNNLFYLIAISCFTVSQCGKCYSYSISVVHSCKCSLAWYSERLMAAVVTLPVTLLRWCASGIVKQCGLCRVGYCVGIACFSLLIISAMLRWPKLHINCFMCSVLQFKDEQFLILNTLIFCHLNLHIGIFLGSHCKIWSQ